METTTVLFTRSRRSGITSLMWLMLGSLMLLGTARAADIEIAYEKFVLDNGLTLIVHEDRKAPIVAVNVWYHVGSKNENQGKTGFAHLFEHLMFNGTENYDDEFFKPLEAVGATGMNGTTDPDRTNYFEVVPTNALDVALWLESDRMGHLLGAITQEKLDEQRGVVQNEKRQGENQPYGQVFNQAFKNIFPPGHPYSWPVIGYMEDLNAATLEDVQEWFKAYYGAANAIIVLAGDISPAEAKAKVERYFGHIPAGPPITKQDVWIPELKGTHRLIMQDRVPQARLYKFYLAPEIGHVESDYLDLTSAILSQGKTSRLYKRLVFDEQIASNVNAFSFPLEIAGMFGIIATAMPGVDLAEIERAIDEEVARFVKQGPTKAELQRAISSDKAQFVRGAERVGGFGGKSDLLARGEIYMGNPGAYKTTLELWDKVKSADLQRAAAKWMTQGSFVIEVQPFPQYNNLTQSQVDRSKLPEPGEFPTVKFDDFVRDELSNGLKIMLAKRDAIPVVNMQLLVDAGFAADQFARSGTANLTLNMLSEGTRSLDALKISDRLLELGATFNAGSDLDMSSLSMTALKENLTPSLDLFAELALHPAFPEDSLKRLRGLQAAAIAQERVNPNAMAMRTFPPLLFGDGHAYARSFTGSGTEADLMAMTAADLRKFHNDWFKPNNATLIVVGDVSMEEIKPELEKRFKGWQSGTTPRKNLAQVAPKQDSEIYILDRPGAPQSMIIAGHLVPARSSPDDLAITMLNEVLGGSFNARINMNLREDKAWSYGARSGLVNTQGQRPLMLSAAVQTDKTAESMRELYKEISEIGADRPPADDEVLRVKQQRTLSLPGNWETAGAVAGSLAQLVRYRLPEDYWDTYSARILNTDTATVAKATQYLQPDRMVWIVVGDRAQIETKVRELGLGEVKLIDADGNSL